MCHPVSMRAFSSRVTTAPAATGLGCDTSTDQTTGRCADATALSATRAPAATPPMRITRCTHCTYGCTMSQEKTIVPFVDYHAGLVSRRPRDALYGLAGPTTPLHAPRP